LAQARPWLLVPIAMLLAGTVVPRGFPAPAPSTSGLSERATVELVLIEVYVTDGRGRPIRDLTTDDFALMVDGHAKPIHSLEFREVSPEAQAPVTAIPPAGGGRSARSAPGSLPRRFVLFFDDSTSAAHGMTAARKATERFLDGALLPSDQVALAAYDRKLRLLHDFTTDRAALTRAIEDTLGDLKRYTDYNSGQGEYEREITSLLSMGGTEVGGRHLDLLFTNYGEEFTPRSRDLLRALTTLVDSLAPYPGYKAIVFMGDGVPENPTMDFLQRFGPSSATSAFLERARKYDLSHEIQILAHDAAAARVTLHSVQTSGQTATSGSEMRASVRRSNALETLALNTGGTRSTSNDLFKGLAEAESAGRAYYLIGYTPEGPPDGQYHTVQVRLKHVSGSLRWRRGFTRLLPEQARQRAVEAAYLLPELYSDFGVEISAVPGPAGGTARVYDLVVHLPPNRVVFVPQPKGATARLESGFVVMDESLHETVRAAREARITLTDASAQGRLGVDFYSRIRVPLGAQTITAVVSDQAAGTFGAARLKLPGIVGDHVPGTFGLSIYSMTEKSLWVEVPPGRAAAPSQDEAADYTIGPTLKTTFAVGEALACGFRLEGALPPAGLRLVIRDGARDLRSIDVPTPAQAGAAGPAPGPGSITINLPLDGLAEGDYQVVVRRKDAAGAETDAGTAPLHLRSPRGTAATETAAGG